MALYIPDIRTPQAQLPRFNPPPTYITQVQLDAAVADLNAGANYRVSNGVLQILNTDQSEWTPLYTVGADGAQSIELRDATA